MGGLTAAELRTVTSFAEVFIEGPDEVLSPREIAGNIDRHLARITTKRLRTLKLTLFIVEHVLPRIAHWPFRASFSNLSAAARKDVIERHLKSGRSTGLLRDLARIRTLFTLGYYGDPRTHASIGFSPVPARPKYQPDKLRPLGLPPIPIATPAHRIECDVCVVGSGAAGAVVAYHAASAGRDVVLLEEGPYVPGREATHDEAAMAARLYKEGGLQTTVDLDMAILQGRCLGGSTVINNAICFRLDDEGLNEDRADPLAAWEAFGASIDRGRLGAAYDRVERMINVGELAQVQDPEVPSIEGNNARVLLDGWKQVVAGDPSLERHKARLFRKNYNRCLGCGYCNFGCPYERKMSTLETYIPAAVAAGARVIPDCHATEITRAFRRATGVRCRRKDGQPLEVVAKKVVVACGTIGSSVLLLKSGISRNVGSRFSFNAGTPVMARFPRRLDSYDGLQMAAYVDLTECLVESLFYPPMAFAAIQPGWFGDHFERMRAYARFATAAVVIGTAPNGRIKRTAFFRDLNGPIDYAMTAEDLQKLRRGMAMLTFLFFAAGAEATYPATFVDREIRAQDVPTRDAALRLFERVITKPEDLTLSSAHPQGGNPMTDDPGKGVVDSQFRVHGYDDLFVCDASVFPATIHINPQLTIMALADYFVHLGAV